MSECISACKAMGSNAVTCMIETLQQKPSKLGKVVDDKLYKDGLARHVPEPVVNALPSAMRDDRRREGAAFLISEIGPDAAAAIPTLMSIFTDPSEGWRLENEVRGALSSMGERLAILLPNFIQWLNNEDRAIREIGIHFLSCVGPKANVAVPRLIELLETGKV